jgi:hypothetical protein
MELILWGWSSTEMQQSHHNKLVVQVPGNIKKPRPPFLFLRYMPMYALDMMLVPFRKYPYRKHLCNYSTTTQSKYPNEIIKYMTEIQASWKTEFRLPETHRTVYSAWPRKNTSGMAPQIEANIIWYVTFVTQSILPEFSHVPDIRRNKAKKRTSSTCVLSNSSGHGTHPSDLGRVSTNKEADENFCCKGNNHQQL